MRPMTSMIQVAELGAILWRAENRRPYWRLLMCCLPVSGSLKLKTEHQHLVHKPVFTKKQLSLLLDLAKDMRLVAY